MADDVSHEDEAWNKLPCPACSMVGFCLVKPVAGSKWGKCWSRAWPSWDRFRCWASCGSGLACHVAPLA